MKPSILKYSIDHWGFVFPQEQEETVDKYYDAVELLCCDDKKAELMLKEIIEKFPDSHIDAYNHLSLAFKNQGKRIESFLCAEKAYFIGKNILQSVIEPNIVFTWRYTENKPFLRSMHILGLEYQEKGNYTKAIELYEEMIALSGDDYCGVNELIMECYLELSDFKGPYKLVKRFPYLNGCIEGLFGLIICDIMKGKAQSAMKRFQNTRVDTDPFISEIIKNKHKTPPLEYINSDYKSPIPEVEAWIYWNRNKNIFNNEKVRDFFKSLKKQKTSGS